MKPNEKPLASSLKENVRFLKERVLGSDVLYHDLTVGGTPATLVYLDGLSDKATLGKEIVQPLAALKKPLSATELQRQSLFPETELFSDFSAIGSLLGGDVLLFLEGQTQGVLFGCRKYNVRSVSEPPTSTVVKGPREGFVEDAKTNLSLVRRRLRSEDLVIRPLTVGRYSKTPVHLVYLKGVANDGIAEAVYRKLSEIREDVAGDSSQISKFLCERPVSLFKQVGQTEKPDIFSAKLSEGRVGILVDGSPIALTVPYLLIEDFQSAEDYYTTSYRAVFTRLLRLVGITVSLFLPAVYVMAQLFQLQLIPLKFLMTVINSIQAIPLSPSSEMMFVLILFEILNEASIRMPKYVGMALSVVGALVLGETAVSAGIVSTPAVMIMALSGICIYTLPELVEVSSVLRLLALLVAGTLGGLGLLVLSALLVLYALSLESFGVPLLSPYAPLCKEDEKDGFLKQPYFLQTERPRALKSPNRTRIRLPK